MRHVAKADANQPGIVKALRAAGASVQVLSAVGKGCPDLLVGFANKTWLLEVKLPHAHKRSDAEETRELTPRQVEWHAQWRGQVAIVHDAKEALDIITEAPGKTT